MPSVEKVIGYTLLGAVAGAAIVGTCGAAGAAIGTTCAGWGTASAAMPTVVGGASGAGAVAGGCIGYKEAHDEDKKN